MSNPARSGNRLPAVICSASNLDRTQWMELLCNLVRKEYPSVKIDALPDEGNMLQRVLEMESGILLVILSVMAGNDEDVNRSIQLFLDVMDRNRDNYVMLCVHDVTRLNMVLSRCMRPAGIMVVPFNEELMRASLRRILNDYLSLHASSDETEYMIVNAGGAKQRIAYRDILYFEAQDKLLNINLERNVVTVRGSLNSFAEELPQDFIRCHRSYIVNRHYIERISISDMTLYLTTGERLPISRSCKDGLRAGMKAEGWK